ncbi:MAG: hypothetical protein M0T84_01310 [Betaproteobacteria bacterium]|nr:hypothetical protein [Betaproteobacteria bacterium]
MTDIEVDNGIMSIVLVDRGAYPAVVPDTVAAVPETPHSAKARGWSGIPLAPGILDIAFWRACVIRPGSAPFMLADGVTPAPASVAPFVKVPHGLRGH